jgi:hypothetical protein
MYIVQDMPFNGYPRHNQNFSYDILFIIIQIISVFYR